MAKEIESAGKILVFGHLDMKEAPSGLTRVTLKQVLPKADEPYWSMRLDDGLFYCENMPQGSYMLDGFEGMSGIPLGIFYLGGQQYVYNIPTQAADFTRYRLQGAGLHYLGSIAFKRLASGAARFFGFESKFDIVQSDSPSESELLQRLLEFTAGTKWQDQVKARLGRPGAKKK